MLNDSASNLICFRFSLQLSVCFTDKDSGLNSHAGNIYSYAPLFYVTLVGQFKATVTTVFQFSPRLNIFEYDAEYFATASWLFHDGKKKLFSTPCKRSCMWRFRAMTIAHHLNEGLPGVLRGGGGGRVEGNSMFPWFFENLLFLRPLFLFNLVYCSLNFILKVPYKVKISLVPSNSKISLMFPCSPKPLRGPC